MLPETSVRQKVTSTHGMYFLEQLVRKKVSLAHGNGVYDSRHLQIDDFGLVLYAVVCGVRVEDEDLVAVSSGIDPDNDMSPRLEFAPEFLSEFLAGLIHGYVVVTVSFPDQRVGYSCHCGRDGMILASGIDYDNLW